MGVREGVVSKVYAREKIHFIGIGGVGMSGIAQLLLELGYNISGSDLQVSEITERLVNLGAMIYLGHHENNLDNSVHTVVVSSAIPINNPEVVKAKSLGIPVIQRAEMLSRLMKRQKGIAVAGAHGKTTTTSLLALLFEKNNYDPTVVLGGEFNDIGGNAKLGQGEFFVAEADESDGSFLKLEPTITVVTNIEDDHLDFYGTQEKIKAAFFEFILKTPSDGFAVLCLDDPGVAQLVPEIKGKVKFITYGFSSAADYIARDLKLEGFGTKFSVENQGKVWGEITLNIPGKYNVYNALAAIAVGRECGLSFADIAASLPDFRGVQRRFEKVAEVDGIYIYDDYAHHPSELKATLAAAKRVGAERVVAVFQPHRFSRTQCLKEEFGTAFQDADVLVMTEIYAAGEKPLNGVNAHLLIEEIQKQTGQEVKYIPDKNLIAGQLTEMVRPGDLVLTLGAGDIWLAGVTLRELLMKKGKIVS
ncbi:MAG: UDP-N-acetylmuramate--L-alanine ligase [Clostridia bacterium]|nr:UDP-N-acetylmuramate--L-alanine ligase [Clostridia bacterium]